MIKPGTRLQHYKDKPYQFLFYALHSETLEELAVYESLYDNPSGRLWVRPRGMFEEALPPLAGSAQSGTPQLRFAPVLDSKGEPLRLLGCSTPQVTGVAARFNISTWEIIDRWEDATPAERALALEYAQAALALSRSGADALAIGRGAWLVAMVLLRLKMADLAGTYVNENQANIANNPIASPLDKALAAELRARHASIAGMPEAEDLRAAAEAAGEALETEADQDHFFCFFDEDPW
jgi:hypothetical protein